jgi:hypothetical protein
MSWLAIASVAAIAVIIVVILYVRSPHREDVEREIAKNLVQFVVVLIFGAAVSEILKERERARQKLEGTRSQSSGRGKASSVQRARS